jgi:tetratricopeptide (TPR) repeat protein
MLKAPACQQFCILLVLLLSVIGVYASSLDTHFFFDDFTFFGTSTAIEAYNHLRFIPRGLSYATLSWTVGWFGLDVYWLRLGNVLIHAVNVMALFYLLRRIFQATLSSEDSAVILSPAHQTNFAFLGAMIFALHPIAVYSVTYLVQRSTLMATTFTLLMLIAYLEGLLREKWPWMIVAALCFFAAIFSKENSVMAPGVALALTFLIRRPSVALFKQIAPYYLLILVALLVALVALSTKISALLGQTYEPMALDMLEAAARMHGLAGVTELPSPYLLSILTQAALFFKYLWLWVLPNPGWMSVDMRESIALSISGPHTLGMVAFIAYFGISVWLLFKRGRKGLLGFAMLYPWIMFLTEFTVARIQEPFVLYRSYLWMPGLLMLLPLMSIWLKPARAIVLLGTLCLILVPLTLNRVNTFSSAFSLWDDAEKLVRDRPNVIGAERIYVNRGNKLFKLKRYDEAIADYSRVIAVFPQKDELVYSSRAKALYRTGRYREALPDFDHAVTLKPDSKRLYYDRALTYRALGDFKLAEEDIRRSCALGGLCP